MDGQISLVPMERPERAIILVRGEHRPQPR